MSRYIVGVDQSTASTKAFLFDENAAQIGRYDIPHRQIHSRPGWIEHDPNELFQNVRKAVSAALEQTRKHNRTA